MIRREIRLTLVKNLYVDIDMENCHVVILQQICKMNNTSTPMLDDYVQNRVKHLESLMERYKCNRDVAKFVFSVAMYCRFYKKIVRLVTDAKKITQMNTTLLHIKSVIKKKRCCLTFSKRLNTNVWMKCFCIVRKKVRLLIIIVVFKLMEIWFLLLISKPKFYQNWQKSLKYLALTFTQKAMKDDYLKILDGHQINVIKHTRNSQY